MKTRHFHIKDIDCTIKVEFGTRKEILGWLDDYTENFQYDWFNPCDDSLSILYDDGKEEIIDQFYDGHKIRRQHIISMVYNNPESYIVYGNFEMNEHGVVTTSVTEKIATENIIEVEE